MSRRRYFVLDETCPASEIPSMIGRVVADKLLPLTKFAPIEPLTSTEPRHNPQDIIPSILPAPSLSTNRKDFLETLDAGGIKASLASFFGFNFTTTDEEGLNMKSQDVKRYTLNNPEQYFKILMQNELYARDVWELLESSTKAYFVVGFLTVTGAIWTQTSGQHSHGSATINVPISELAGVPMPQLDVQFGPSRTTTFNQSRTMRVVQEEIFAIAYCPAKTRYSFDKTAPRFIKKTPRLGPPKRAKAKRLAMGYGSSDEEIEDDSEEEKGHKVIVLEAEVAEEDEALVGVIEMDD